MTGHADENRVRVILVGYNSADWIQPCLATLASATSGRLSLVFVDNHNNPSLRECDLSAFDVEILSTPGPLGFAEANNFALKHANAKSELTVFLNQDTVSNSGWIDCCAGEFTSQPNLGILSPGLRTYDLTEWEPNLLACVRESGLTEDTLEGAQEIIKLRQVTAAAMMIRSDLLEEVGPFDPIFGSYYEDYDLCRRVRNAGYVVAACPPAVVGHFSGSVSTNTEARRRRARTIIRNQLIHCAREKGGARLPVLARYLFLTFPRNVVRGLLGRNQAPALGATLGATWDLLRIADRLVSSRRDQHLWRQFLETFQQKSLAESAP